MQTPPLTIVFFSCVEIEPKTKYCSIDPIFSASKQGHFWPRGPTILSKDVYLHAAFSNVKISFSPKFQIFTPEVCVLHCPVADSKQISGITN